MAEITAKLVNELRAKTGQGMMECKKALSEVAGDMEKAVEYFRKKGVKASLSERAAGEGRVFGAVSGDKKSAALVELNCNTDFTAKSEPFQALGAKAAQALVKNPTGDVSADPEIAAGVTQLAQTTGENIRVGKTVQVSGERAGVYLYGITGKIGVAMSFTGNPSDELITDLGGHIAFSKPLALTRDGISADVVEKERSLAVEQAKATGKPEQIAQKIAEGKLNAFFKEQSLLDQDFFNAQKFKGSITQMLSAQKVTLEKYVRIEVGQA
jgi:elongation factor Ts